MILDTRVLGRKVKEDRSFTSDWLIPFCLSIPEVSPNVSVTVNAKTETKTKTCTVGSIHCGKRGASTPIITETAPVITSIKVSAASVWRQCWNGVASSAITDNNESDYWSIVPPRPQPGCNYWFAAVTDAITDGIVEPLLLKRRTKTHWHRQLLVT
jgi:hypothetical protein